MSRQPPRRPDVGVTSSAPAPLLSQPRRDTTEAVIEQPPYLDGGWIVVQWLWPLCFFLLPVAEVGMYLFRKLTN